MLQVLILIASGHAEVLKKLKTKELITLRNDECTLDDIEEGRVLDNQVSSLQVSSFKMLIFLGRFDLTVSPFLLSSLPICLTPYLPAASLTECLIKTHEIFTQSLVMGGNKY